MFKQDVKEIIIDSVEFRGFIRIMTHLLYVHYIYKFNKELSFSIY